MHCEIHNKKLTKIWKIAKEKTLFRCLLCDRCFLSVKDAIIHFKTPHKFKESNITNQEVSVLSQEINVICDICNKQFQSKGNLGRHLRTVHKTE